MCSIGPIRTNVDTCSLIRIMSITIRSKLEYTCMQFVSVAVILPYVVNLFLQRIILDVFSRKSGTQLVRVSNRACPYRNHELHTGMDTHTQTDCANIFLLCLALIQLVRGESLMWILRKLYSCGGVL